MADPPRNNGITDGGVDESEVDDSGADEEPPTTDASVTEAQADATSGSRVGSIIDDDGRLFGLINVVDLLVILVVLAVAVAGIALVAGTGSETDTRYATIDAGTQPDHIANQISAGDEWSSDGSAGDLTITDVYRYVPSESGDESTEGVGILIQAQVNGTTIESESETTAQTQPIEFAGEPLRFGRSLEITTNQYVIESEVVDISQEPTGLNTNTQSLAVETEVDSDTAAAIQPGDAFRVGDQSIVTVESVTVYPTGDPDVRRVVLGVTAETRIVNDAVVFGDRSLRTGGTLPIRTSRYELDTTIIREGSLEPPGVQATRTVTMEFNQISPNRVDAIAEGMVESAGETETATVVSKTDQPAEILSETSDGYVIKEHPIDRDMELTLEMTVREQEDGTVTFRGEPLRIGQDLTLELGGTTVQGSVQDIQ